MKTKAERLLETKSMSEYRRLDIQIPDDGTVIRIDPPHEEETYLDKIKGKILYWNLRGQAGGIDHLFELIDKIKER